jgi:hypothetical protein
MPMLFRTPQMLWQHAKSPVCLHARAVVDQRARELTANRGDDAPVLGDHGDESLVVVVLGESLRGEIEPFRLIEVSMLPLEDGARVEHGT